MPKRCVVFVVLALLSAQVAFAAARPSAVVYASRKGAAIYWQRIGSSQPRRLFQPAPSRFGYRQPGQLGYLPSPDGRWLLVWQTLLSDRTAEPVKTRWLVVSMPDGETATIGEAKGDAWLLPYWKDNHTVLLEGDLSDAADAIRYDLRTRHLSRPLPPSPGKDMWYGPTVWRERARLIAYAHRHYSAEMTVLYDAVPQDGVHGAAALYADYEGPRAEPPELLLLRGTGIPDRDGLNRLPSGALRPELAVAPGGRMVAYAWVCGKVAGGHPGRDGKCDEGTCRVPDGLYACVDVLRFTPRWHRQLTRYQWKGWKPTLPEGDELVSIAPVDGTHGRPLWPNYRDLRWSRDGRYLSFGSDDIDPPGVSIFDTATWKEVLHLPDAANAFVVPAS